MARWLGRFGRLGEDLVYQGIGSLLFGAGGLSMTAWGVIEGIINDAPIYIWSPLALVGLAATAVLVHRARNWRRGPVNIAVVENDDDTDKIKLIHVSNKNFINQEVVLDGSAFFRCRFDHVTFMFSGGEFGLMECELSPKVRLRLQGRSLVNLMQLLQSLRVLTSNVKPETTTYQMIEESPQQPLADEIKDSKT